METQTATLRTVYRRILSRGIQFEKNSGELLDRLDDITFLLNLRETDPTLAKGIQQAVMSGIETIKDLSFYLKDFVLNLESDHPEFALLKKVFKRQRRIQKLCEFEYIVGYEWAHREFNPIKQAIETHRGDLVLMNESGNFLVVELKSIQPEPDFDHRMRRAQRLQLVRDQTEKFRSMFQQRFSWAHVEGLALTNFVSYLAGAKKPLQRMKGIL
ncbi:MAG: hypothetical protein C4288_15975 [Leptolyngbya sp. ERB_1_1]